MDQVLPSEFVDLLRLSLNPSADLLNTLESPSHGPSQEHLRKIIAAVLWHRKFVVTYYVVAFLYLTMTISLSLAVRYIEHRLRKY